MNASLASTYAQICRELGAEPSRPFVRLLDDSSSKVFRLAELDLTAPSFPEQLRATALMLSYSDLEELDASGLSLSPSDWEALLEACAKCGTLQALSLKGCRLGELDEEDAVQLAQLLGRCCSISVLDVSHNGLGDGFVAALSASDLLVQSDRLTVVDLSENCFGCDGLEILTRAMESAGLSCPIKQLDVSFNVIGDRGACALGAVLEAVPLVALEAEGNEIGDLGGQALAAALKHCIGLQRLNLNYNAFTAATLAALADALRVAPGSLQELAVAGCSGGEEGAAALLAAAAGSSHLRLLDVRGVQLAQQAIPQLLNLLSSPTPLETLRLDVGSKAAAEKVAQALAGNTHITHLMLGGPVPEHVLSFIGSTLSNNAANRLAAVSGGGRGAPAWVAPPGGARMAAPPCNSGRTSAARSTGVNPRQSAKSQGGRHTPELHASAAGLAGGGAAMQAAEVFRRRDADGSGFLDKEEMLVALDDLGMLEGMKAKQLGKVLSDAIKEADVDGDGQVSLEEFVGYFERLARLHCERARQGRISARRHPPVPVDAAADEQLKKLFKAYCRLRVGQGRKMAASVQQMNAAQFNLLAKDAQLVEPQGCLVPCAVDIIFCCAKPVGSHRLPFKEFLEAIAALADEAGCTFGSVVDALAACSSPLQPGSTNQPASPVASYGSSRDASTLHRSGGRMSATISAGSAWGVPSQGGGILAAVTPGRPASAGAALPTSTRASYPPVGAAVTLGKERFAKVNVRNTLYETATGTGGGSGADKGWQARLAALEGSHAKGAEALGDMAARQHALEGRVGSLSEECGAKRVQLLELKVQQLASALQRLEAAGPHQAPRADGDAVAELERRLGDRQNRIEAALMQVARQVDVLDCRLKEEQEGSLRALEAILANASSSSAPGSAGGAAGSPRMAAAGSRPASALGAPPTAAVGTGCERGGANRGGGSPTIPGWVVDPFHALC